MDKAFVANILESIVKGFFDIKSLANIFLKLDSNEKTLLMSPSVIIPIGLLFLITTAAPNRFFVITSIVVLKSSDSDN